MSAVSLIAVGQAKGQTAPYRLATITGTVYDSAGTAFTIPTPKSLVFFRDKTFTPPGPIIITNSGIYDSFVVKYNSDGTPQWARKIGGTEQDKIISMILDASANVYVCGYYNSNPLTIYNADGTTSFANLTNSGSYDTFIVKYNTNGTPQWARTIGGSGNDYPVDKLNMRLDAYANVYFSFINSIGFPIIYIVKYNSDGTAQWERKISSSYNDNLTEMLLDASANVYVCGYYISNPLTIYDIDGITPFSNLTALGYDSFIVKYNSDGTPQWVRKIGGTGQDKIVSMILDASANVYVCGYYDSTTLTIYNADGTTPFANLTNSSSNSQSFQLYETFIVKYNSDGVPQWVRKVGGYASALNIKLDSSSNLYVCGYYNSTTLIVYNIDGTTSFADLINTNVGVYDIFIVKYNSNGVPQWVRRIGGNNSKFPINSVVDSSANIYVSGYYQGSAYVLYNNLIIYNANGTVFTNLGGDNDTFIVKYNSDGTPQWVRRVGGNGNQKPSNISVDASSNLFMSGYYEDSSTLTVYNPDGVTSFENLTNSGRYDNFIVKYNSNGVPQWLRKIGGSDYDETSNILLDASSNVYVIGYYYSSSLSFT